MNHTKIAGRLEELREQLDQGRRQLDAIDRKRMETHETMLRIAGAMQVLEELLAEDSRSGSPGQPAAA